MRIPTLALAGALALSATAAWAADPMANTYANTVTTKSQKTGAAGNAVVQCRRLLQRQHHRPRRQAGRPIRANGSLKENDATICLSPTLPNPPPTSCSPIATHAVGESWTVTNDQGETFDVSITAGR